MKNQITLDFCVWLQRNFDEILAEGPEWHKSLQLKWGLEPSLPMTSSKAISLAQIQAKEWDTLQKIAHSTLMGKYK